MTSRPDAQPDEEELSRLIDADEIDTVVVAFPDLQGRLVGKRVTGRFYRRHVGEHGIDACSYLLAVDVDMTTVPGYRFASWETGYGDVLCRPDPGTRCGCCRGWRRPRSSSAISSTRPPAIPSRSRRARSCVARSLVPRRPGTRSSAVPSSSSSCSATATRRPRPRVTRASRRTAPYIEDYHILQTTRDEYLIRAIRNGVDNAGIPVEFSKGEAGLGQHEINLEYAEALEMADRHAIYKNAAKEIAGLNGRSLTFMAKYDMDGPGSSCHIHSSVWDADGETALMHDADAPEHMSDVFRGWLGGSLAFSGELAWLFAPTVNSYKRYQPESWAPTAIAWGRDNRTCGFRVVGDSPSEPPHGEPHPRRRLQSVPRVRRHDRGRSLRHRARRRATASGSTATRTRRMNCRACRRTSSTPSPRWNRARPRSTRSVPRCTSTW